MLGLVVTEHLYSIIRLMKENSTRMFEHVCVYIYLAVHMRW